MMSSEPIGLGADAARDGTWEVDLAVLGSGMAGYSGALFALRRGLSTAVMGGTGHWAYASGPLDLLGVHPVEKGTLLVDPWIGIQSLVVDLPQHPYARVSEGALRAAFALLLEAFREVGYPYCRLPDGNCEVITSLGTKKRTYCLPHTMWDGSDAFRKGTPTLIVDFEGMRDFSAKQIVTTLSPSWPALRWVRVPFPGAESLPQVSMEYMARSLDLPKIRARLIQSISSHVGQAEAIGFPPMLGFRSTVAVIEDLKKQWGVAVFEIPSASVSVPGLRMRRAFEASLRARGALLSPNDLIGRVQRDPHGNFELRGNNKDSNLLVRARSVLLASGRFLGGGLVAGHDGVREAIFDLPVTQPADRAEWHRPWMLDPRGHPINQAGIEVDDRFRPLSSHDSVAFKNLFAAGSILAHQDWMRAKCGAGLSIGTSYAAVEACAEVLTAGRVA